MAVADEKDKNVSTATAAAEAGAVPSSEASAASAKFPLGLPPKQPEMPFNPFLNHSTPIDNPWEVTKCVLMFPIFIIRVLLLLLAFFFGYVFTVIALTGAKDVLTRPFPKWRRNLLWPVSFCARVVLFACGYNYIQVKGKAARRDVAPILICNHVTFVDPVFIFVAHLPMLVTAKENLNIPVAGLVMKALQVVVVDRASPTSRRDAAGEIKRRAMCNDWGRVAIFPEATTTNGRSLVSFKTGAFTPGLPVQPVLFRYPYTSLDPSWVADGMADGMLLYRMMSNWNNKLIVEYLDPIVPTAKEQKDARLFADRCRQIMAAKLNVNTTEHTFGDVLLALEARKLKMPHGVTNVEFGRMERLFQLDAREAKGYLRRFKAMDVTRSGVVSFPEFIHALDLPDTEFTRSVFDIFDTSERGHINFREFVAGLAFISRHPQFRDSVEAVFKLLDGDKDGKLAVEDAKCSLARMFPAMSKEGLDKLFQALGLDKSEYLSWDQFSGFLRTHPEYVALILAAQPALVTPTEAMSP